MTGYITGAPLDQLYSQARLFVLPSYHEGLPIVLLEAMSYGLPVLASDIPANKEVGLPEENYFQTGDVEDLLIQIEGLLTRTAPTEETKQKTVDLLQKKYNWDTIAEQTIEIYSKVLNS